MNDQYVHYGCGWTAPTSWRNFDASPTLRVERLPIVGRLCTKNGARFPPNVEYGDIVKGLPVAPESCQAVYCSHVLEHLSLDECRVALRNTFRILRPGGIFRCVLPDLEVAAQRYMDKHANYGALEFIRSTGLGREKRATGLKDFMISWLGHSQHFWMWDYASLEAEHKTVGFTTVRRAAIGDSEDPAFRDVETTGRWDRALGIEARK